MSEAHHPLRVRPYALTGGRTRPTRVYPIEALVRTRASLPDGALHSPEEHRIAELCRQSRSVAEVAAVIGVPLGVARVLIADLDDRDVVHVHTQDVPDQTPGTALLERVLSGLRKL